VFQDGRGVMEAPGSTNQGLFVLDLHRLRLLRELKHRGTLAAVATALSYSPSTISAQLSQLEREVGVPLLAPAGRRVRLTPEAEILVGHVEAVLERLERAEADIARSRTVLEGDLRIATFQTAAKTLVLPALA
jgi:DNA-binding transcriptional LysR family regulator